MRRFILLLGVLLLAGCGAPPTPTLVPVWPATSTAVTPTAITIPTIGVTSSLIPLGLNADGTLEVPSADRPLQAAWFDQGPAPGQIGPAVISGHVDGRINGRPGQPGIFHRLHELRPGDLVHIDRADGSRVTFKVISTATHPKEEFPTDRVYGDTAGSELRLITCSGPFRPDVRSYADNIVVYAKEV